VGFEAEYDVRGRTRVSRDLDTFAPNTPRAKERAPKYQSSARNETIPDPPHQEPPQTKEATRGKREQKKTLYQFTFEYC